MPAGLLNKDRTFELTQAKLLSEKVVRTLETWLKHSIKSSEVVIRSPETCPQLFSDDVCLENVGIEVEALREVMLSLLTDDPVKMYYRVWVLQGAPPLPFSLGKALGTKLRRRPSSITIVFDLPSLCTASSQAFLVNAFRPPRSDHVTRKHGLIRIMRLSKCSPTYIHSYIRTYIHDFILSRIYRVAKKLISSREKKERKIYK